MQSTRRADDVPTVFRQVSPRVSMVLLVLMTLVLGLNWPLLSIGLRDLSPLWLGAFRMAGATLVIMIVAAGAGRLERPPRQDLPVLISIAVVRLALILFLVFTALRFVPAGRSAVLVWTTSLWTVPMAAVFLGEQMTFRRWTGLVVGICGIVVLVEPWESGIDSDTLLGYGLLILAAIANAATSVHVRGHRWKSTPLGLLPWQLALGTVPLLIGAIGVDGFPSPDWGLGLVLIVVYQGALATGFVMWATLTVLRSLPAVTTNLTLMLVPPIGVISSVVVLGEEVTAVGGLGMALIAVGVMTGVQLREVGIRLR